MVKDFLGLAALEFRRGRGVTGSGVAVKRSAVLTKARELVQLARRHGYRQDEIITMIESIT